MSKTSFVHDALSVGRFYWSGATKRLQEFSLSPMSRSLTERAQHYWDIAKVHLHQMYEARPLQNRVTSLLYDYRFALMGVSVLAALLVVVRYFRSKPLGETWSPPQRSEEEWKQKMSAASSKAYDDHYTKVDKLRGRYFALSQQSIGNSSSSFDVNTNKAASYKSDTEMFLKTTSVEEAGSSPGLQWTSISSSKDPKPSLQFVKMKNDYILAGNFGYIKDCEVAVYANKHFYKYFKEEIKNHSYPPDALAHVVSRIQREVEGNKNWDGKGATMVVSYVDKTKGLVYTCTVGPQEAFLYRNVIIQASKPVSSNSAFQMLMESRIDNPGPKTESRFESKAIPLSPICDWYQPTEEARAPEELRLNFDTAATQQREVKPSKQSKQHPALSISRAIGCRIYRPSMTCEPEFTVQRLEKGDKLILSDGLFDKVHHKQISDILQNVDNISDELAKVADAAQYIVIFDGSK